ncbi:MAG: biopolymer transporter ExbD [Proteobacteria bacterium]|nr:biopolymer transporter ExbD [Pseudomonadota bacterium]NBY20995.1 biopolymer transporter ExbD [bacterium]
MAKKPSSRTHRSRPDDSLNLTPLIDMITCLMFFLLMFASILPVVMIDAPLPKVASTAEEVKQAKNDEAKMEVTVTINSKGFTVKSDVAPEKSFSVGPTGYPYTDLHKYLVGLKSKRPNAKEITLMPSDDTVYETMIGVMDASRELFKDDPGYQALSPEIARKPESQQFNRLFPEVSIGGV